MTRQYDVFVSFKNTDETGKQTRDAVIAGQLYGFLTQRGIKVFFAPASLVEEGEPAFAQAVDRALEQCRILVAVGTSGRNLASEWVQYEWGSFFNEIRGTRKPEGRVFVYHDQVPIADLPFALRQTQAIPHGQKGMETLYRFIDAALRGIEPSPPRPDEEDPPPGDPRFFEGLWEIPRSRGLCCARLVDRKLRAVYSIGSGAFNAHWVKVRVERQVVLAKFEWFKRAASGYMYLRAEPPNRVEGAWWHSNQWRYGIPEDLSKLQNWLSSGHPMVLERKGGVESFPARAKEYFRLFAMNNPVGSVDPQRFRE